MILPGIFREEVGKDEVDKGGLLGCWSGAKFNWFMGFSGSAGLKSPAKCDVIGFNIARVWW